MPSTLLRCSDPISHLTLDHAGLEHDPGSAQSSASGALVMSLGLSGALPAYSADITQHGWSVVRADLQLQLS